MAKNKNRGINQEAVIEDLRKMVLEYMCRKNLFQPNRITVRWRHWPLDHGPDYVLEMFVEMVDFRDLKGRTLGYQRALDRSLLHQTILKREMLGVICKDYCEEFINQYGDILRQHLADIQKQIPYGGAT